MRLVREPGIDRLHSRKLRGFDEPAIRQGGRLLTQIVRLLRICRSCVTQSAPVVLII